MNQIDTIMALADEYADEHAYDFKGNVAEARQALRTAIEQAIREEREACARLCDDMEVSPALSDLEKYRTRFIADSIRSRG